MSGSITPTPPGGAPSPAPKGQVVQIVSLPDSLENNARALRIEGEVIQQNRDGSVRVRTEQGDIDLQVRGRQPQQGAKVEIDLPAGRPPTQATIRPAPQQAASPQPAPPPQTPSAPPIDGDPRPQPLPPQQAAPRPALPATPQAPSTPPSDPVDVIVTTKPAMPAPSPPPAQGAQASIPQAPANLPTTLPPLSAGQSVQILPLSAADGIEQALPDALTAKTTAQATVIAQKAQGGLISTMLQAVKSVLPNMPVGTTQIQAIPPETIGTPQPSTVIPGTNAIAIASKLPTVPLPVASVTVTLGAQIVSVLPPLNQRIFMPQAAAPIPMADIPIGKQTSGLFVQTATQPITVTVEQISAQNKPVISIPAANGGTQSVVLQASAATAPPGTQLTILPQLTLTPTITPQATGQVSTALHIQPQVPAATVSAMPPAWRTLLPLMQPAPIWPVIDEMFQTFYQTTPQAAQILGRIMPSPANAATFGPAVLLFLAAVKSGDLQAWLGDKKLEMLTKLGKASLVSRLSADTAQLAQNADTAATDWKSYPFPLLHQNEISKVMLYLRREPDETESEQDKDATHFIMDVALTRMGSVQLDALVRSNRVDLVVRTELPISSSMQDAMRTAYARALDNTNIFGDIGFQSDIRNFVRVTGREDALASA